MSKFRTFSEFYPFYLDEHRDARCRYCHFVGTTLVLVCLYLAVTASLYWLAAMPLAGYGFAWIGHFVFEKNRPATFKHPLYSFMGDWVMYFDMWRGRVSWR